jgi:hypothetical protein
MAVAEDGESADFPKKSGTPRLSYLRMDAAWQDLAENTGTQAGVDAWDLGLTAGFGPFAGQYRQTRFDSLPNGERPRLHQSYFLYRMSYLAILEWNLGAGASALETDGMGEAYLSFTSPVRLHLPYVCLEAVPSWSEWDGERFRDLEFAAITHVRGIGLRAGYRWLEAPGIGDVSGAFAGVSLFW